MYMTSRYWFKYGNEDDELECTTLFHETLDKAINYAHRYAKGVRFASVTVEDEEGNILYEICDCGAEVFDYREEVEEVKGKKERIINFDVPLNKRNINANIKVNILEENKMRELGFTDYSKNNWYYCKAILDKKNFRLTFNLSINKQNSKNFEIDVLDEAWLQPYDYQAGLKHSPDFKLYLKVHERVQRIMKYLIDVGIIEGYNLGDYI